MPQEISHITLSQLQERIKAVLGAAVEPQWIVAEIGELKVNNSGHCYLELVEKGGANHIPKAKARAVIWSTHYLMIRNYFIQSTGRDLEAGLRVMVNVEVNYHELYGLSLVIRDIDPTYTLGDMERQRQETIARLKADGIFEMNKELELPPVALRLAVISSGKAAGFQDFMRELEGNRQNYRIGADLFEAFMQGDEAERSIIAALEAILPLTDNYDAVVIIRGGGSQSDLGCFDSYCLCSYIAQFPLPVVTGIGHDKDVSVADMVAHTSLKTPTAVARFFLDRLAEAEQWLDYAKEKLRNVWQMRTQERQMRLTGYAERLVLLSQRTLHKEEIRLLQTEERMAARPVQLLKRQSERLERFAERLVSAHRTRSERQQEWLKGADGRLRRESVRCLNARREQLLLLETRIAAYDPEKILSQGYAILTTGAKTVKNISDLHAGDTVTIRVSGGTAEGTIHSLNRYGKDERRKDRL